MGVAERASDYDPGSFPFLLLPPELRHMIYDACVPPGLEFTADKYQSLLLTCHMVREECMPIFDNHFQAFPDIDTLRTYLENVGPVRCAKRRRLAFGWLRKPGVSFKYWALNLGEKLFRLLRDRCTSLTELTIWFKGDLVKYEYLWHKVHNTNAIVNAPKHFNAVYGIDEFLKLRGLKEVHLLLTETTQPSWWDEESVTKVKQQLMQPKDQTDEQRKGKLDEQ